LRAYKKSPSMEFVQFANSIANDLAKNPSSLTIENLMGLMNQKFDEIVAEGEWTNTSSDAATILALTAALKTEQDRNKRASSAPREKGARKKKARKVVTDADYPPWKLIPPSKGEPKSKFMDVPIKGGATENKEHHWCQVHRDGKGLWCTHTPKECQMAKKRKESKPTDQRSSKKPKGNRSQSSTPQPQLVSNHVTFNQTTPSNSAYQHTDDSSATSTDSDDSNVRG
jgi:hypothetical protein